RIASAACSSACRPPAAGSPASPKPSLPCTWAASTAGCSSGVPQPANTGTPAPQVSTSRSALATVWSRPTLPAVTVSPTTSWRGSLKAINTASASSTPGSVSIKRGILSSMGIVFLFERGEALSGGRIACGTADPAFNQAVGGVGLLAQQALADAVHLRQQVGVAHQVGHAERRQAGLARAQQFARSAQFQVLLGDHETVAGLAHRLQPLARHLRQRRLVQQHAAGRLA